MVKRTGAQKEGIIARKIRDVAGTIALIGVAVLGGFALTNLRPGWDWTVNDEEEQLKKPTREAP